ncbi:MAG: hypothetical protein APR54_10765 [Candidatus Cloacimonas sp. SDB]|nr:MAG: hypothetical protein APR54_10765 [Candidatus Cloacimonas sp. SDB]
MRKFMRLLMVLCLFGTGFTTLSNLKAAEAVDLEIYTEDYPPLNFSQDGIVTGLATEVVRELMHRTGTSGNISLVSWEEGYNAAMKNPNTAIFSITMTPERKEKFQWVGPLAELNTNFYALPGAGLTIANLDDARKIEKIATVKDYYTQEILEQERFTNLESYANEEIALEKVLSGEAQLFVSNNTALPASLQKIGVELDALEKIFTLSIDLVYIAFSHDIPSALVAEWQKNLNEMKQDGTFAEIYAKWLPDVNAPGILQMMTEEYPPITFMKDGKPAGFVTDMVREIAARQNIQDNIHLTYWNNAYNMALLHPNVILFSADRTPERENFFHWVGPVGKNSSILYRKKGSGITINSLDEAKKVSAIATTTDWFNEQYLKGEGFTNLVSSKDPIDNVKKLMNGDVQLLIFSDLTIPEIVRNSGYSMTDLEPVYSVSETDIFIAVSKDTPVEVVNSWQSTLDSMKKDGTFQQIYQKYLPNAKLDDLLK